MEKHSINKRQTDAKLNEYSVMAEIRELVLTFLERLSHHALPKNRQRETLDACINLCALHCELRNTEQLLSSLGLLFAVEKDNIQVPSFSGTFYLVSFLSYCFHSLYPLQGFYFCAVAAT